MADYLGVILAAGRGKRMGLLGEDYPKALLPVANQPLIAHHLALLRSLGVRRVFVVVGHRARDVAGTIGAGASFGLEICYVEQHGNLGSAHALGLLRPYIDRPFLIVLGDYFFSMPEPRRLLRRLDTGRSAAILVKRESDPRLVREACEVHVDGEGRVVELIEKPAAPRTCLKGCGFYALGPDIFDAVARTPRTALRDEYELTVALGLYAAGGGRLYAEEVSLYWDTNFTRPEDLLECNMQWLWHRGVDRLIADDADVGRDSQLDKVVVGRGARIQGPSIVKETVIFGGTSLSGLSTLERTVATPQRLYKLEDRKTP